LFNYNFKRGWEVLRLCEEVIKETPDKKIIEKLFDDINSKNRSTDIFDIRLLTASGDSLHDEILDNLVDEFIEFKHVTTENSNSIISKYKSNTMNIDDRDNNKQKMALLHKQSINILSHIYKRLDYLRTK
jgi:hypothetical protein